MAPADVALNEAIQLAVTGLLGLIGYDRAVAFVPAGIQPILTFVKDIAVTLGASFGTKQSGTPPAGGGTPAAGGSGFPGGKPDHPGEGGSTAQPRAPSSS